MSMSSIQVVVLKHHFKSGEGGLLPDLGQKIYKMSLEYLIKPESAGPIRVMSEGLRSQLVKAPPGENGMIWASIIITMG